jgi:bifunctional DNA-binding transcriptional regulator/antitoxin component of YhaV-PrlF toxin-antitoxin module
MAAFTLRIAGKRQVTLPEEVLSVLNLEKGDQFRIEVRSPSDIRLVPYTLVRKDLITPEIDAVLQQRRKEIDDGAAMVSLEQVMKKANKVSQMRPVGASGYASRMRNKVAAAPSK